MRNNNRDNVAQEAVQYRAICTSTVISLRVPEIIQFNHFNALLEALQCISTLSTWGKKKTVHVHK